MTSTQLFSAIGQIDEKYIDQAAPAERPRRRLVWIKFAAAAACLCLILLGSFSMFSKWPSKVAPLAASSSKSETVSGSEPSSLSELVGNAASNAEPNSSATEFELSPYDEETKSNTGSSKSPTRGDSDYSSVTFTLNGNRVYKQINESEYEKLGIEKSISSADFGKKIGEIVKEESGHTHQNCRCTVSPKTYLNGCEVYRYTPISGEAIVIVKGNGHISIFEFYCFEREGHDFNEILDIYGADSSEDIKSITSKKFKETREEGKSITASQDIASVYKVLTEIKAYALDDPHIGTPDWLNKAYEEYYKTAETKYLMMVQLNFKNGLSYIFKYEPYIGSGYINGHEFLSEQQNEIMKSILL